MPFDRVHLSYARWFSNDKGASPGGDVLSVQVSADAGATWQELERPGESAEDYREVQLPRSSQRTGSHQHRNRWYGETDLVEQDPEPEPINPTDELINRALDRIFN